MMPRFYDPAAGAVKIDGRDIREFALPALREPAWRWSRRRLRCSTPPCATTSRMGKLGATDDEIVAAAKAARLHDFVMSLPAGYDTMVGERGSRFSGGQRQRLAIAGRCCATPRS